MHRFVVVVALFCAILFFLPVWGGVSSTIYLPILRHEPPAPTDLVVNEVLALNGTVNADPQTTQYYDWIELYNPTNAAIDASGYMLSDDPDDPAQWQIPDGTTVAAYDHLLIYANGENWESLYANFKLSNNGETLVLSRPDSTIVDQFEFGEQVADVSFGRLADGGVRTGYFGEPSPSQANSKGLTHQSKYDAPQFSHPSGFYTTTQVVTLSSITGTKIRYTLDGSTPDNNSPLYKSPLSINETIVLKSRVYGDDMHPSRVEATTYLITDEPFALPVVSIGVDAADLFSDERGIYVEGTRGTVRGNCSPAPANYFRDWERPITIEMFEPDGTHAFMENAGVKIFGFCTRQQPQKSLAIHFRDQYGNDTLDYPVFSDGERNHHALVLRASGNDWANTMMRDAIVQDVLAAEFDWDGQRARHAVLFINGEYWGIHNIRDKLNEAFLEEKYGYDQDKIDILEINQKVSEGSADHYLAFLDYLENSDSGEPVSYPYIQSQIDVSQYIDYQIANIFFDNTHWPGSNLKYWRPQQPDGIWRWFFMDMDASMMWANTHTVGATRPSLELALATDSDSFPNPPWSTYLFRKLMQNTQFRDEFLQRFSLYLDHVLTEANISRTIEKHQAIVAPEMLRHIDRWQADGGIGSLAAWDSQVSTLYRFAAERPSIMREQIEAYFDAATQIELALEVVGQGQIEISTVRVATNTVSLYADRTTTLQAIPQDGYQFVQWEGAITGTSSQVEASFGSDQAITAVFAPSPQPIINEIHYNPSGDLQGDDALYEFIELYNPHDVVLDLTGYAITDGIVYTFTAGTVMPPDSYLILAQTATTYADIAAPVLQWTDGGLKNSGEQLTLSTPTGTIADTVDYDDGGDWPGAADGDGGSLTLVAADLDNSLPTNWTVSPTTGGSPGAPNE